MTAAEYTTTIVTDLDKLRPDWEALLARSTSASPFLTPEWCITWCAHYGQDGTPHVLVTRRRTDGHIVGLAPLILRPERRYGLIRRRLAFIGEGVVCADHLDVLVAPGEEGPVLSSTFACLDDHRREWDLLDLYSLAAWSPLWDVLSSPTVPVVRQNRHYFRCPYVTLPGDWDTFFAGLSKNTRSRLRRSRRQLERGHPGQVAFGCVDTPAGLDEALSALARIHRVRWRHSGDAGNFGMPRFADFHRQWAELALARGWLRLYTLKVSGQIISLIYCMRYRDVMYDYQGGFDEDWGRYRVGHLAMAHAIQQAIAEGAAEFDFLRGHDPHKYHWTNTLRWNGHVQLCSPRRRARALQSAIGVGDRLKAQFKHWLPDRVIDAVRRRRVERQWLGRETGHNRDWPQQ